jgi:plasmid stabilization system protein ParE
MARVVYSRRAVADLKRLFEFLADDPSTARDAVHAIRSAVELLAHHPLIGRIVADEIRELVISYGKTGYVALYRHLPARRVVRILAVRAQRELDYSS